MPLSSSEKHVVDAVCVALSNETGRQWNIAEGPTLDDLYPNEPSPEVIVTDGSATAAIEVTELPGGAWNHQMVSQKALERELSKYADGEYLLIPPSGFTLPISKSQVIEIGRAIRAAISDTATADASVRIPRSAAVSLGSPEHVGHVYCCHHTMNDVLHAASQLVKGSFLLLDNDDSWEHEFQSESARTEASKAIANACNERLSSGNAVARWEEEWPLNKLSDDCNKVSLLYVTTAVDVRATVRIDILRALEKKFKKFENCRWGDEHILALVPRFPLLDTAWINFLLAAVSADFDSRIDRVTFMEKEQAITGWRKA